jgi:cytochrome P450/NADPH-cytochrome P450 reductase
MVSFLQESGKRSIRPTALTDYVYRESTRKYWEDVKSMREVAGQVIESRRGRPSLKKDLVDAMLHGADPKTGKTLPDENIIDNMITFLIAGKSRRASGFTSIVYWITNGCNDCYRT